MWAIALAGTGALLLLEWTWQERRHGKAQFTLPNLRTFVPMLGAIAGILSYFAYNQLVFGGPVPVSGATKRAWSQLYWHRADGYDLLQNLREMTQLPVFDDELLAAAGIIVGAALLWWWLRREERLLLVFVAGIFSLAAGHVGRFALSVLTVHPDEPFWPWHFAPAYLMMALAYPVGCMVALYLARRFVLPRKARAAGILRVAVVVPFVAIPLAQADVSRPFRNADAWSEEVALSAETLGVMSILVMNRLLPEGSIIGSWDAGIIGYFSEFPVVNLDGLVNDYEYLHQYGGEHGPGMPQDLAPPTMSITSGAERLKTTSTPRIYFTRINGMTRERGITFCSESGLLKRRKTGQEKIFSGREWSDILILRRAAWG